MSGNVVKAYIAYRQKHAEIVARQRTEREATLKPYLVDLGREMAAERQSGTTVREIQDLIGLKNKSFIYGALDAFNGKVKVTLEEAVEAQPKFIPSEYQIDYRKNNTLVVIDGENFLIYHNPDGSLEFPDEWLKNPRAIYKEIIREIQAHGIKEG